jgi:hypothetical protein
MQTPIETGKALYIRGIILLVCINIVGATTFPLTKIKG